MRLRVETHDDRGFVHPPENAIFLTSTPYPVEVIEGLVAGSGDGAGGGNSIRLFGPIFQPAEGMDAGASTVEVVSLRGILQSTTMAPEGLDAGVATVQTLVLDQVLITLANQAVEGMDAGDAVVTALTLDQILLIYNNYAPEGMDAGVATITALDLAP